MEMYFLDISEGKPKVNLRYLPAKQHDIPPDSGRQIDHDRFLSGCSAGNISVFVIRPSLLLVFRYSVFKGGVGIGNAVSEKGPKTNTRN